MDNCCDVQIQKAVSAHFSSEQILPFGLDRKDSRNRCSWSADINHTVKSCSKQNMLTRCWHSVVRGGPALGQYRANVVCLLESKAIYLLKTVLFKSPKFGRQYKNSVAWSVTQGKNLTLSSITSTQHWEVLGLGVMFGILLELLPISWDKTYKLRILAKSVC